ncbi:MAG TPA: hypothetical protein VE988_28265 [Gemmataceae bacterium]|nr:hypothetical protein [Gemmataceae bacterium]
MILELTEQQRQVLQPASSKPIDVVDPSTQLRYVLLTVEQYDRLRGTLPSQSDQQCSLTTPAMAAPNQTDGKPLRQCVQHLPIPPEVAAEAERFCTRLSLWKTKNRREVEERMKLQHYYGGKWIAYLRTGEGLVVVAVADDLKDPAFDQQLSGLTGEERRRAIIDSPTRLFDQQSEILTPFPHED